MAEAEGAFARAARLLVRPGASRAATLAGLLALTALVTAVLNLDTAAAFMTPLLLYAGGTEGGPFLYAGVLMANAASLFLPGSNLTNLLVLGDGVHGLEFLAETWPQALVAVAVTGAGLLWWARGGGPVGGVTARPFAPGPGVAAVAVAAVLVLALPEPALPVLAAGVACGAAGIARGHVDAATLRRAVGPLSLLALFALAVTLGTLARELDPPALTAWETTGVAAAASVLVNNLPAAALLSAHPPAHPEALLIGLNLGPNLVVTGSLSALIWWRTATALGARPSVLRYSAVGAPLAVVAMTLANIVTG